MIEGMSLAEQAETEPLAEEVEKEVQERAMERSVVLLSVFLKNSSSPLLIISAL